MSANDLWHAARTASNRPLPKPRKMHGPVGQQPAYWEHGTPVPGRPYHPTDGADLHVYQCCGCHVCSCKPKEGPKLREFVPLKYMMMGSDGVEHITKPLAYNAEAELLTAPYHNVFFTGISAPEPEPMTHERAQAIAVRTLRAEHVSAADQMAATKFAREWIDAKHAPTPGRPSEFLSRVRELSDLAPRKPAKMLTDEQIQAHLGDEVRRLMREGKWTL